MFLHLQAARHITCSYCQCCFSHSWSSKLKWPDNMSAWLSDDPVAESLQNSTAHLWLIQKVSRVKKKKESYFFSQTRKIKMRGGSEINWMMIKLSVLFSGFEFTRSPCFWEQQKFMWLLLLSNSLRRHFSTRDPHPCCTSRPFGSSTCYYTVLALPSLLYCGITPPGLHSSQHLIDLHTLDFRIAQSLTVVHHIIVYTQWKHHSL